MKPEEVAVLYISQAQELEAQGRFKEAERYHPSYCTKEHMTKSFASPAYACWCKKDCKQKYKFDILTSCWALIIVYFLLWFSFHSPIPHDQ